MVFLALQFAHINKFSWWDWDSISGRPCICCECSSCGGSAMSFLSPMSVIRSRFLRNQRNRPDIRSETARDASFSSSLLKRREI